MVFDAENAHRRRSSMNSREVAKVTQQGAALRENTACFVHQLLERQRKERKGLALNHITEDNKVQDKHDDQAISADDHESTIHSRLLTKKQLSEMARGVRDLSKRLGSIRLKLRVRTVFLLTKAHDEKLIGNTREVADWLLSTERQVQYTVYVAGMLSKYGGMLTLSRYVEKTLENNRKFDAKGLLSQDTSREGRLKYWTNELCAKRPHTFDVVLTVCAPNLPLTEVNAVVARR